MVIPQCAIFLALWFYVKSILADFRRSKTANLTILEALNFDFWKYFTLGFSKILKNWKSRAVQMVKMGVFRASKWPKLISRKIWVAKKIRFPHRVSHFPIRLAWSVGICALGKKELCGCIIKSSKSWEYGCVQHTLFRRHVTSFGAEVGCSTIWRIEKKAF